MHPAFDFGENWSNFSKRALTDDHFRQGEIEFGALTKTCDLSGRTFLDIGFGQGLSLMYAQRSGAKTYGLDINPLCETVYRRNSARFEMDPSHSPQIHVGSILDPETIRVAKGWQPHGFDIVHSWGVLHHTGHMWQAIENAASLVRPGGHLIIAIYNRHWSSETWRWIKIAYVRAPRIIRSLLNVCFVPVIYSAKLISTGKNPLAMERGMDFYYNVVDWIGGYPYEYAGMDELRMRISGLGFESEHENPANVPTGCNEMILRRVIPPTAD